MTYNEKLLINTVDDLQQRLSKGDEYNLIRAAGLIRQLLIDENPLVDQVNKSHREKILFRVQKRNTKFQDNLIIDGVELEVLIGVSFIIPSHIEEYTEYLKRDDFLKYKVIYYAGQDFTVLEIIKLCAHIYGGVHAGKIKEEKDLYLDWANKTVSYDDGLNCAVSAMKAIIQITIEALQPLINKINKSPDLTDNN